jgi:hypothetical protein
MKKILFVAILALLMSRCNVSSSSNSSLDSLKIDTTKLADTTKKLIDTAKSVSWDFHEDTNKMDDSKIYYADLASVNELSLQPPYDGDNSAHIKVRKKGGENNVILLIDKGQFVSGVDGTTIKARFDKNKPEIYECSESTDYNSRVLFINSASRFISKLKKSKKLIIEATLYQDGNQQLEFNVDGFKWNH